METIKDFRIDFYGDNFFIVGFQMKRSGMDYMTPFDDMRIRYISEVTTKVFSTPGVSLN